MVSVMLFMSEIELETGSGMLVDGGRHVLLGLNRCFVYGVCLCLKNHVVSTLSANLFVASLSADLSVCLGAGINESPLFKSEV